MRLPQAEKEDGGRICQAKRPAPVKNLIRTKLAVQGTTWNSVWLEHELIVKDETKQFQSVKDLADMP